jgi:hypothetical protein
MDGGQLKSKIVRNTATVIWLSQSGILATTHEVAATNKDRKCPMARSVSVTMSGRGTAAQTNKKN